MNNIPCEEEINLRVNRSKIYKGLAEYAVQTKLKNKNSLWMFRTALYGLEKAGLLYDFKLYFDSYIKDYEDSDILN